VLEVVPEPGNSEAATLPPVSTDERLSIADQFTGSGHIGSRVSSRSVTSGNGDEWIETRARSIWPSAIAPRCPAEPVTLCRRRTVTSGWRRRNRSSAAGRFTVPHDIGVPSVTVPVS